MASNPPGQCCTTGFKHEGEPTGQKIKVGKYDAYIATPPASSKVGRKDVAILYVPDVLGIWHNSMLLADQFAASGYLTLIIDVMNGDPMSLNQLASTADILGWLRTGTDGVNPHTKEVIDPIVLAGAKYLREERGANKVGAVGYCFGAKYVIRHSAAIDAGFIAHPSWVEEEELASFKAPLSIAAAEIDGIFPIDLRYESEKILTKGGQPFQINLYSQAVHGFAVRCDLSKKTQRFAKEQALLQALMWFDTWLVEDE